jgi:hypothetical protein
MPTFEIKTQNPTSRILHFKLRFGWFEKEERKEKRRGKMEKQGRRGKKGGEPNQNSERKIQITTTTTAASFLFNYFFYDPQFF